MSWKHGTRGDWMYADQGSSSSPARHKPAPSLDDSGDSSDDSLDTESVNPRSSRARIISKSIQTPESPMETTPPPVATSNGHVETRDLKKVPSRNEDSDGLSAGEWKIVSDNDDDDESRRKTPLSDERKKSRPTSSYLPRSISGKSPRAENKPAASLQTRRPGPRIKRSARASKALLGGDSPGSNSSNSRQGSQTDANAMAAIMAEKHPWRRRRGSNGEDPIPSPPLPSRRKGHLPPSQPSFKTLARAQAEVPSIDSLESPGESVVSDAIKSSADFSSAEKAPLVATVETPDHHNDDSSVALSAASFLSSSSGSSQSSGRSSPGGFDSEHVESDGEEEEFTMAFQESQDADTANAFPLSFLDPSAVTSPYLDHKLLDKGITRNDANRFALEHRILLRAILQLLAERDHVGVEASVDDPENTIKKGPLKKYSRITGRHNWKVKYVEVRKGSFSYFEDSSKSMELPGRKIIPLRANMYSCRAVNDAQHVKGAYGCVLELAVEDGPTRLWMANSEEERAAWIRAIRDATIGGDMDSNPHYMDMKPYEDAIEKYKRIQGQLGGSRIKNEYTSSLDPLWGKSLRIPVPWVRDHLGLNVQRHQLKHRSSELSSTPMATLVKSRVTDLWKKLSRESVSINGHLLKGDLPHGTERIVGALSRCILEHDGVSATDAPMTELQAISHGRNVLLAYYKSRDKDEAYFAVDSMTRNAKLVVCLPSNDVSQSPLHIQVYSAGMNSETIVGDEEKCGWVLTRSSAPKRWKNRYCVVSEGVLSYYEKCLPRPHGLRGQLVLVGATMDRVSLDANNSLFVLKIVSRDGLKERELCFRNEMDMLLWKEALQHTIDTCTTPGMPGSSGRKTSGTPKQKKFIPKIGKGRLIKGATEKIRGMLPEKMPSFDETNTAEGSTNMTSDTMKSDGKEEPTVQILVESSRYYKIVAADPTLSDKTWCTIRANYLHSFLLSGGPQGQVSKGDEVVEMEFLQGGVGADAFDLAFPRAVGP